MNRPPDSSDNGSQPGGAGSCPPARLLLLCFAVSAASLAAGSRLFTADQCLIAACLALAAAAFFYTPSRGSTGPVHKETADPSPASSPNASCGAPAFVQQQSVIQLLSEVSHDLRTSLNNIVGFADLIETPDDRLGTSKEFARIIAENGRSASRIIADLVEVARIEAGDISLVTQTFDFADLVRAATSSARPLAGLGQVLLDVEIGDKPVFVTGDLVRLRRVVDAVVECAIRHASGEHMLVLAITTNDAREITLRIGPQASVPSANGNDAVTSGKPVPADRLADFFGTPLAIAYHLARLHGGHLTVFQHGPPGFLEFRLSLPDPATSAVGPSQDQASQRLRRL